MPIYAYKCESCGFAKDVLQKLSDPPLTDCPSCRAVAFSKQLTAAGFQLKGTGWYATDFKGGTASPGGGGKAESGSSASTTDDASTKTESGKTEAVAAPAASCSAGCACH